MLEDIKKPLRYFKRRWFGTAPATELARVLDCYPSEYPSSQLAINLFAGEWSALPPDMHLQAGPVALFADQRMDSGLAALGGMTDQTVLELGPSEGGTVTKSRRLVPVLCWPSKPTAGLTSNA